MNLLIMLAIGLAIFAAVWAVQSIALKLAGEPLAWPMRYTTKKPLVRYTARVMIHVSWIVFAIAVPLALGIDLQQAIAQAFPTPVPWRDIAVACAIVMVWCLLLYAVEFRAGWLRIEPQYDPAIRRGKLIRRFPGPWLLATLEEAVFRGVVLEQLLRTLPPTRPLTVLAVVLSAALFSAMHFIKFYGDKPVWQPAYGYFIVGCLFGLAYIVGGRSLWLPIAMHGGAVFVVEVMRLYAVIEGPRWLAGYSYSPQSGLVGSLCVLGMAIALVALI
jgi:hypothetical protein